MKDKILYNLHKKLWDYAWYQANIEKGLCDKIDVTPYIVDISNPYDLYQQRYLSLNAKLREYRLK